MADSLLTRSNALLSGELDIEKHHPLSMGSDARLEELIPGVAFVESFCNVIAFDTNDGLVIVDAGSPIHAQKIYDSIRGWSEKPLHSAIYTHGHVDHIYAVAQFEAEGNGPCRVIGHDAVAQRFRRYEMTNGYNGWINGRQFQLGQPIFPGDYRYPDETYADSLTIDVGGLQLELFHDRGETDDGTWVWAPKQKVLCTGDLFIWASPNCGNPQKAQRYCDEWARALRKMADLGAELLLPGHGLPIAGADQIRSVLEDTATYLESIFTQTIDAMNTGASLDAVLEAVQVPPELAQRPWLRPVYDEPEFIIRNIWRLYGGWYDGDPSHLKPAPAATLGAEIASLAGSAEALAQRAVELSEAGQHRLSSHLVEFAWQAEPTNPAVAAARASVYRARATTETSTMAKGIYTWAVNEATPQS